MNENSRSPHSDCGYGQGSIGAPGLILNSRTGGFLFISAILFSSCYRMGISPEEATDRIQRTAMSYVGTPYRYGGADRNGMDCSGLIVRVFMEALGISLPHSASTLFGCGRPVMRQALRTGDLVFFKAGRNQDVNHVGLFLDRNRFIHTTSTGVSVSRLDASYYQNRYAGARRIALPQTRSSRRSLSDLSLDPCMEDLVLGSPLEFDADLQSVPF